MTCLISVKFSLDLLFGGLGVSNGVEKSFFTQFFSSCAYYIGPFLSFHTSSVRRIILVSVSVIIAQSSRLRIYCLRHSDHLPSVSKQSSVRYHLAIYAARFAIIVCISYECTKHLTTTT